MVCKLERPDTGRVNEPSGWAPSFTSLLHLAKRPSTSYLEDRLVQAGSVKSLNKSGFDSAVSRIPSLSSSMSCSSLTLSPSVSRASRKSLSMFNGTALVPSPLFRSPSVSTNAIEVASRFSSLTSKPSLVSVPSNSSSKPSPSASVVASESTPVWAVVDPAVPRSSASSVPSLSLSRSR